MTFKNIVIAITLITSLISSVAKGQSTLNSEEDLKKRASELFEEKKFTEAAPLYAQLLSLYPKEPDYNFKYGACLLYADSDKSKALKYLAFATSKSNVDNRAFYYAGKGFHLNYQFTKALKNYNRFKTKASSVERKEFEIDQQIEMVKNGNELLKSINRLDVISKESVSKSDFFRIYQLEGLNGKLVVKPDEFKTKFDKKNEDNSVMFLPDNASEVYFSSYGKNGDNGRDIYKAVKLGNGKWSEAVSVGNSINTPFDEAFAFILPDGRTMYFASKGHNSMGGYDLFKSTYDENVANWTAPVNLDFPFSTVNDDVMFVTNEDQSLAYFASDRNNVDDQYFVYKVGTEPKKPDLFVIKGSFIAENIPNLKRAKITVVDAKTNETIGVYETDEKGNYAIEVEQAGGEYKFNIETTSEAPIHAGIVSVPKQEEFAVLGQELRLVGEGNDQKLVIKNIFDGSVNLSDYSGGPIVSAAMLSRQANMDQNANEAQILADVRPINTGNTEVTVPADATATAKNEVVRTDEVDTTQRDEQAEKRAAQVSKDAESIKNIIDTVKDDASKSAALAFAEGYKRSNEALAFFKEGESQLSIAATASGEARTIALKKADEANSRGQQLALESKLALDYAAIFEQKAEELTPQSVLVDNSIASINASLQANDIDKATKELATLKGNVVIPMSTKSLIPSEKNSITNKKIALEQEIANADNANNSISSQIKVLEDERNSLESTLEKTKNKKEIAKIESRLSALKLDEEDLNFEITKNKQSIAAKRGEVQDLQFEERFITKLENNYPASQALLADIPSNQKSTLQENVDYFSANSLLYEPSTLVDSDAPVLSKSSIEQQIAELPTNGSFEERIKAANLVQVEDEKNLQLAEINRDWSNSIDQRIRLNEQLKTKVGENEQSRVQNRISELTMLKQEKKSVAEEYQRLAKSVSADQLADASADENTPEPPYNEGYRIDLKQANGISDDNSRLESQIAIYEDWNESINNDIKVLENRIATNGSSETTSRQLASLKEQTEENSLALARLQGSTDQVANTTTEMDNQSELPLAVKPELLVNKQTTQTNNGSNLAEASTSTDATSSTEITLPKRIDNTSTVSSSNSASNLNTAEGINYTASIGTADDDFSDLKYASDIDYSSNTSKQLLASAEEEKLAAKQLMEQYETVRSTALSLPTASERAAAMAAADDLKMQSERKQVKASSLYSDANKYQYVQQNNELNNYPKFSQQFQSKNLDLADLLLNESEYYIAEAQRIRASVEENERFTEKTIKLQKAYNFEVIALKKQQEAKVALNQATVEYENPNATKITPRKVETASVTDITASEGNNVLAAREAEVAKTLRSEVVTLDAEILTLQNQLETTKKQSDREVIEAEIITLTEKRDAKENQAEILERRGEQLTNQLADIESKREERLEAIFAEKKERNKLRGATQLNQIGVDAGEVSLTEEEYNSIKTNPAYVTYANQIKQRNQLIKEANVLYEEMEIAKADKNTAKAASLDKMIRIKNLLAQNKEAEASKTLARVKSEEAIKMRMAGAMSSGMATGTFEIVDQQLSNNTIETPQTSTSETSNTSSSGSTEVDLGNISNSTSSENKEKPITSTKTNNSSNSNSTLNLKATDQGIFSQLSPNESVYSKNNPIPIDVPLPDGIIYKVQVGAFRNPISQDLFKGFAPLMGEKVSTGITRYTAGIFLDFANADEAKKGIRALGYKDAFVVAFKDGKRINVSEARDSKSEASSPSKSAVEAMVNKLTKQSIIASNPTTALTAVTSGNASSSGLPIEFTAENVAPVKNIEVINGVYFTVQVGVYSKPITKGEIDVPELAVKVVKDKLYRYSSGVYNDAVQAAIARDRIKLTVPDAFVIAYNNGTKISLEKALELLNQ